MTENPSASSAATRYYDIDWLRVLATIVVFLFHAAKPFLSDLWHIKNAQVEPVLEIAAGLVDVWMMPLLFIVSGMSIALSLRSRTAREFAKERFNRIVTSESVYVELCQAIKNYSSDCETTDTPPKDIHSWLAKDRWRDYLPENYSLPLPTTGRSGSEQGRERMRESR